MLGDRGREILSALLYDLLHCRSPRDAESAWHTSDPLAARDLTQRLSESNTGRGCWQAGWIVRGHGAERFEVAKYGIRWFVSAQQVRSTSSIDVGAAVHVRIGKEQTQLFPGFYMAFGNADDDPDASLVRFYWNISVKGAAPLVSEVTQHFNGAAIPFRLKVLIMPDAYRRTDAAVLYVPRSQYGNAHTVASQIHRRLSQHLSPAVSAFAKPIARGVGLAQDPGPGKSFGRVVAGILAEALSDQAAYAGGTRKRTRAVLAALHARGVNPERPYLIAGSNEVYRSFDD